MIITQEAKAKAYDKAIEKVKQYHNKDCDTCKTCLEGIFDELKDEMIKKSIFNYFERCSSKHVVWDFLGVSREDTLAWLEKQGQKFQYWTPSEEQLEALDYAYNLCPDTERGNYYEGVLETIIDDLHKFSEKQVEPAKTVYNIGDWIIGDEGVFRITNYHEEYGYELTGTTGFVSHFVSPIYVNVKYRLWSINDVKDGDVLVTNSNIIFIFKFLNEGGTIEFRTSCTKNSGAYFPKLKERLCDQDVYPATQEQRNLLFQKMHEAGYEWDSEKKKLKKIEHKFKIGDWIAWEEHNTALIVNVDDDKYEVEFIDGNKGFPHIDYIDRKFHLWTIQDVKDGNVLTDGKTVVIFKNFDEPAYRQHIIAHIGLDICGDIQVTDGTWTLKEIKPATKEQRDILFSKMHEAGYKWDAENKQLLSLKAEPTREIMGNNKKISHNWTDDDEQYLLVCKNALRKYQASDKWDADIISKWLEDKLKKPKWSEDNEVNLAELTDKVIPKFKVGDWIVNKFHDICLITDIDLENDYYICESNRFGNTDGDIDLTDKAFHLWTIQDANDGDILFSDLMDGKTFIYNGVNSDGAILYSFIINNGGEDILPYHIGKPNTGIGTIEENKNIIHPATKKQRDLLFQKMKEAGYEWDSTNNQLLPLTKHIYEDD